MGRTNMILYWKFQILRDNPAAKRKQRNLENILDLPEKYDLIKVIKAD